MKCSYCYNRHTVSCNELGHGVDVDVPAFKSNKIDCGKIILSGGEPFVYPGFVELCKKLTEFSNLYIATNGKSSKVYDFADQIDPKKVIEIHCSVHIGQRNDYNELLEKILYLREKGFQVFVSQVAHPSLLTEYVKKFEEFKQKGVLICPKVFEGAHHLREYPPAYTEHQRRLLFEYVDKSKTQSSIDNTRQVCGMLYGQMDWKGIPCNAGWNSLQIQYNGDAYRCHGHLLYLGNLYKGYWLPYYLAKPP